MVDYNAFNSLNSASMLSGADKQMLFQERLSNTAHTREVEDLKNAGLNPILSAHNNGASVPSGSAENGEVANPISEIIATVNNLAGTSARTYQGALKVVNDANKKLAEALKDVTITSETSGISNVENVIRNKLQGDPFLTMLANAYMNNGIDPYPTSAKTTKYGNTVGNDRYEKGPFGLSSIINNANKVANFDVVKALINGIKVQQTPEFQAFTSAGGRPTHVAKQVEANKKAVEAVEKSVKKFFRNVSTSVYNAFSNTTTKKKSGNGGR